ncbi:MAG: hypothetical protein Q7S22_09065 [Candidatus Micrarchaeota archaeon]|nr:hypothetical protein [Candidatus Micrarchaeota archaeon]
MQLFKLKTTPEQKQKKINAVLARCGLDIEGVNLVEHVNSKSLKQVRNSINSASKTGKISGFITTALNAISPLPAGFTDPYTGAVHVQRKTGVLIRLHETVHGHDLTKTEIGRLMSASIVQENSISLRHPVEFIMFKLEEIRLQTILEGRAKFCEKLAGRDMEFGIFERVKFKLSVNTEALLFVITSSMTMTALINAFQNKNQIWIGITLMAGGLALWSTTMLAPYVQGMWFMEKINQKIKNPKKAIEITAERPPTTKEIFLSPNAYLRRVLHQQ